MWDTILHQLLLRFSVTTVNTKSWFPWSWLMHLTTDLTHTVKAKGTAVSVHANNTYKGGDVQLYSFLPLAVDRSELSSSYVSSVGTAASSSWTGGWVGTKTSVDNLKNIKITVTARNWALDLPTHSIAAILTDLSQFFSINMKDVPKIQWYWSSTNTLYFTRVMINIAALSHDSAAY